MTDYDDSEENSKRSLVFLAPNRLAQPLASLPHGQLAVVQMENEPI